MGLWQARRLVEQVFGAVEEVEEGVMYESVPFNVVEEYELGDLSEVKEDRVVLPVNSGVAFRIQNASSRTSKDGSIKSLTLELRLVEGIDMPTKDSNGNFTGVIEKRYQNKPMFVDLPYWVDTNVRITPRYLSKNKPYLVPLRQFLLALGYDIKQPPKINDELFTQLVGRELKGDIAIREIRVKNPLTTQYEGTGDYRNEIRKFQPA